MESKFYILHNLNEDDEQEMFEIDQDELFDFLELIFSQSQED